LSSPPGAASLEENRIINEYMEHRNLQQVASSIPCTKKQILLKKFFKRKRNQQVIVYSNIKAEQVVITGKVSAIGRDYVMLTNLKERIWIPYSAIESANTCRSHKYI
jgi:ribosome maturation factor RimP